MTLIVEIDDVLRKVGGRQLSELTPRVTDPYGQYLSSLAGLTMLAVANAYDGAAQRRLEENDAICALFEKAIPHLPAKAMSIHLASALKQKSSTIKISDLNKFNVILRKGLIKLHTYLENNLDQTWAATLNKEVLEEYVLSANRHRFDELDSFV